MMFLARSGCALRAPRTLATVIGSPGTAWKRWNTATATADGPPVSETNRAEATMKRFWKDVGLEERGSLLTVTLDGRALKTPSGKVLALPESKSLMASLIAAEWDHQATVIKPHALPATSIVSRAIDGLAEQATRAEVEKALLKYIDTDTICFYQDHTPQIQRLQAEHWDPLLEWTRKTFEVEIDKASSLLFSSQPEATKKILGKVLSGLDEWELAVMERATYTTKSFIIALALTKKHLSAEQAALAATVEISSQIERWGEVEDTHDVDYHDIRRQLGSAACLLSNI